MTDTGPNVARGSSQPATAPRAYLEAILRTMRQPLVVLDGTLAVEVANRAFYEAFHVDPAETEGRKIYGLGNGQWDIPKLRQLLEGILPKSGEVSDFRVEHEFERIGRRVVIVNGHGMERGGEDDRILLAFDDVTDRERERWELEAQKEYAEKIVDASRDALLILGWDLRVRSANETFYQKFRVDPSETEGRLVYELGNGQWNIPKLRDLLENVLPENNAFDDFEVEHEFEGIGPRTVVLNARRIDHMQLILLAIEDRTDALRTEEALRERERRLRHVLDGMGEAFGLLDHELRIITRNEIALRLDGRPLEDILGRTHWDIYPGAEASEVGRLCKRAIAEQMPVSLEHRYHSPKGGTKWLEMRAYPVPEGLALFWRDITARKESEAALRESEERFRILADTAPALIWRTDERGDAVFVNRHFLDYTGKRLGEVCGDGWRELVHPDHVDDYAAGYLAAVRERRPWRDRNRVRRHDGAWRWFENHAQPFFSEDGRYLGHVGVSVDIQPTVEAEEILRESDERFRQFGEAASDALWIRNAETFGWEYLSPAFEGIYGVARKEAFARGSFDVLTSLIFPEDRDRTLAAIRALRDGGRTYEYRIRRPADGEMRWLRTTGFRLVDSSGTVRRLGGITHDMTEEKRSAERMEILLAELQHRTRNLITVIRAMSNRTLSTSASLGEFGERFGKRLEALARVNGLLSCLEEGGRVTFDELLHTELSGHGIAVHEGSGPQVSLDGPSGVRLPSSAVQTLALALHELMTNATKHGALSRAEGRLAIGWRLAGRGKPRLRVEWRETGIGPSSDGEEQAKAVGYGRELIERALPYQLGAETEYDLRPDGLRCVIVLPVSNKKT